ncbi:hypothetical protein Q1695_014820 [Nippostrongylus brasiliensis]|nr:hypothetical protein Q1695_014820 [Nippostrongylus brasiliensis]
MVVATFEAHLAYLWIGVCFIVSNALIICGADKNRERIHIAKRQELKNRQRDAMLAGRPVQTVIEEAEPLIRQSSSRISCVREIPDLQSLDKFRRQRHEQQRCEIPNFNNVALESTQSSRIVDGTERTARSYGDDSDHSVDEVQRPP